MPDPNNSEDFDQIIAKAIRDGEEGRKDIVRHLSRLSIDELARVPANALSIIGPEGLAKLASRQTEFAGLAPKVLPVFSSEHRVADQAVVVPQRSRSALITRILWFSPKLIVCLAIAIGALVCEPLRQWVDHVATERILPLNAAIWPSCDRLDHWTDGCVYKTGSSRLSLARAAGLLDIQPRDLADLNRHLSVEIDQKLGTGSQIIILRDRSRLAGE